MPITCVYGLPGRNKTHFSCYYAFSIANKFKKSIVANFLFHPDNLIQYCSWMGYQWLLDRLKSQEPTIYYCPMETKEDIAKLLSVPNSVVICDEAGGYFPARNSMHNTPAEFIKDITQVRHRKQYFIAITQSENLLDSAIRLLADEVIYCNGISLYDQKLEAPRLIYKVVRRFTPDKFASWFSNPRLRGNPIKTMMMANKSWTGQLSWADYFLFKVYPSFYLVHEQFQMIQDNSYFPDSVTRYSNQQATRTGASAIAPRPRVIVDASDLIFASSKQQIKDNNISLSYILPSHLKTLSLRSSFYQRIFTSLPAEFLPIIEKFSKPSKRLFYFNHKYLSHKIYLCLFILGIFFVISDVTAIISLLFRILLSHSSH